MPQLGVLRQTPPPLWMRCIGLIAGLAAWLADPGAGVVQAASPNTHLTISYSERVGDQLALWIANDAGYFRKQGLDVTLRYLPSNEGIPALLTGQVQIASIGGPDALSAEAQGAKLKYVAVLSPILIFQLWVPPKYAHPSALKGQRIGVASVTGSGYAGVLAALQRISLSPRDVIITSLGSVQNVNSAMLAGSIVATASHPPISYEFQKHGFVNMVDLRKYKIGAINAGLLSTESYIHAHPKIVQAVVDALMEAIHREKTDKAFTEKIMMKYMHVRSKAAADFTYNFYARKVLPAVPMPVVGQLEPAWKALRVTNRKMKGVDLAAMIDQHFVKIAVSHGMH